MKTLVISAFAAFLAVGCGSVDALQTSDAGTGGTGDVAEGGADALPDTAPTRPLNAGCTSDTQCSSGFCATASGTTGTCCTGRPDACNTCVGGYLTPVQDGYSCSPNNTCVGDVLEMNQCRGGVCMVVSVQCAPGKCTPSYCPQS